MTLAVCRCAVKLGTRRYVFLIFASRIKNQAYICPSEVGRESCREAKGGIEWRDREKSPLGFHCRIFISKDSYTRLVTKNAGLFLNALIYQEMEPIPLKYKVFFLMPDGQSSQFTFFFPFRHWNFHFYRILPLESESYYNNRYATLGKGCNTLKAVFFFSDRKDYFSVSIEWI